MLSISAHCQPLAAPRVPAIVMREATWKPGTVAPAYLDGSLPADAGCDPLCLAALALPPGVQPSSVDYSCKGSFLDRVCPFPWSIEERKAIMEQRTPEEVKLTMDWMRAAELKHSRLAMLAVVGWPLAELFNPFNTLGFTNGRAPALLNGGLDAYTPFLLIVAAGAAYAELQTVDDVYQTYLSKPTKEYVPGDLGFDPLDLQSKFPDSLDQRANEIYNGRMAMRECRTSHTHSSLPMRLEPSPCVEEAFHLLTVSALNASCGSGDYWICGARVPLGPTCRRSAHLGLFLRAMSAKQGSQRKGSSSQYDFALPSNCGRNDASGETADIERYFCGAVACVSTSG